MHQRDARAEDDEVAVDAEELKPVTRECGDVFGPEGGVPRHAVHVATDARRRGAVFGRVGRHDDDRATVLARENTHGNEGDARALDEALHPLASLRLHRLRWREIVLHAELSERLVGIVQVVVGRAQLAGERGEVLDQAGNRHGAFDGEVVAEVHPAQLGNGAGALRRRNDDGAEGAVGSQADPQDAGAALVVWRQWPCAARPSA